MTAVPAAARDAAAQLTRLPIRLRTDSGPAPGSEAMARGWIAGLEEAASLLGQLSGREPEVGTAFSSAWPYVAGEGWLAAPAVPVVASTEAQDAVDGCYRLSALGVQREAAGEERLLLSTTAAPSSPEPQPFDLLWFSPAARWLLRGGVIEAEDPFCRVRATLGRERLETLLVRAQRIDGAVLEGLQLAAGGAPATLEIRRDLALSRDRWRDPQRVLGCREGVQRVEREGEGLLLRLEGGGEVRGKVSEDDAGWGATFGPGLPWTHAEMSAGEEHVVYRVTLTPDLDPLDPGVRTRLAFDLLSDLLELEKGG